MALLTTQIAAAAGVAFTYAACSGGGDTFLNTGRESILLVNADDDTAVVATFTVQSPCSFGSTDAAHNRVVTVPFGTNKRIGPFPKDQYNDVNNLVYITYDVVTGATIAVIG